MRPGPAGLRDHGIGFGQGVLDQLQALQHGAGQLGVLLVEVAGQRLEQLRDLIRILPLASWASTCGSRSPTISAVSMARADTLVRLAATEDSLIETSSSLSSSR